MRICTFLFLFVFAIHLANADMVCVTAVVGVSAAIVPPSPEVKVQSWNLGAGFSFERNEELYYINTPDGPVNLPAGHYANFHNLTAIARQPDSDPRHPEGFIVLAVNDGRLSHLLVLDAMTGQKYRHRLLDGVVTSIKALPDSMLLMAVSSPEDVWPADRGDRLELVDTNIHGPHDKIIWPKSLPPPEIFHLPNGKYRFRR